MNADVYRSQSGQRAVEQSYRELLQRWAVPLRHHCVATREGDTFVLDCGPTDAPPVVLLHGAGSNSAIWQADASRWSLTHRLYMVDLIGEPGLSAPSRPPLDSDAYALWLDDLLGKLGVEAAGFVGVSLGGWLATDYAIRRPGRVERLALRAPGGIGRQRYGAVLAALALMPFGEPGTRRALRIALGPGRIPDPVIDYMLLIQRNYRPRRDTLPVFCDEDLRDITAPLFVVLGARDRMLNSHDTAARLTRLQPAASINLLPDAGHGLLDDGAELYSFLNQGARP
ncbi:Ndr family protein [Mycolicibacterium madagascariense]|uniref:Ndr family protein n=1 Tax=Mycolicibacterium madagascariense TaxID=212765 RepID=A0A7I7XIA7_9MYCO|nr:alpha/beta fold hydrolase [Mycolicibacterium madagascariense]MCV7010947.1 alpha/beta fold hydrolase [Mycolicibacterium madagascariense]BBZ28941.1 Ndr family protein [Mycolicibacterium madagascariense]